MKQRIRFRIHRNIVDTPLDMQIAILKKARSILIGYCKPMVIVKHLLFLRTVKVGNLPSYNYHINGLCDAICCATIMVKYKPVDLYPFLNPETIISLFNHKNAITYANAGEWTDNYGYWWDVYRYPNNRCIRNLQPRIKFLNWMIYQLEYKQS